MTQSPGDGYFIGGVDLFLPVALFPDAARAAGRRADVMLGVGRLKAGVSVATANADLDVIGKRLLAADPKTQAGRELTSESAHETVVGASRPALLLLFASVGVVLLIACVNVSQLLLARAIDRQKEIALRAALGASRSAVTRQLTVEAALMAVAATLLGFLLGRWALAGLRVAAAAVGADSRRRSRSTAPCCCSPAASPSSSRCCAGWRRRCDRRGPTSAACCRPASAARPARGAACATSWSSSRWRCRSRWSRCPRC